MYPLGIPSSHIHFLYGYVTEAVGVLFFHLKKSSKIWLFFRVCTSQGAQRPTTLKERKKEKKREKKCGAQRRENTPQACCAPQARKAAPQARKVAPQAPTVARRSQA